MGNGFVTDPGQLTALATALYRLKGQYDATTVTAQATGEDFGSWDVESGMETVRARWTQKRPEVGGLLDQLGQAVFAAAREYGWTEEQARQDAADRPGGETSPAGGTSPGAGTSPGSGTSPGGPTTPGEPTSPGDPTTPGDPSTPAEPTAPGDSTTPGDSSTPGDPSTAGEPTAPADPTAPGRPVDTDDGTPDYRDTDSDDDGIPDAVEKDGNPDARVSDPVTGTGSGGMGSGGMGSAGPPYGGDTGSGTDPDSIGDPVEYGSGGSPLPGHAAADTAPPAGLLGSDAVGGGTGGGGTGGGGADPGAGGRVGGGSGGSGGGVGSAGGAVPEHRVADPATLTGGGSVGSGSGTVGLGGDATGGGTAPAADRDGLPVAAAIAPVGLLGAAGAAAWAVHRRKAREEQA